MKLPRIPRRWRVRLATGATVLALLGGATFLLSIPYRLLDSPATATTVDSDLADQVRDAARFALRAQGVDGYAGRRLQQESPTRWQVSLVSGTGAERRCWKVAVGYEANAAAPIGQVAEVGCWPLPDDDAGPTLGEAPDRTSDLAARGFLEALLAGGDWARYAEPGLVFPQPAPLASADFALLDSHQHGDQVAVNGWVRSPTADDPSHRADVTWRVTLTPGPAGPVVTHLDAGPPPPSVDQAPSPTAAPTTSTSHPTTTTTSTPPSTTTTAPGGSTR